MHILKRNAKGLFWLLIDATVSLLLKLGENLSGNMPLKRLMKFCTNCQILEFTTIAHLLFKYQQHMIVTNITSERDFLLRDYAL